MDMIVIVLDTRRARDKSAQAKLIRRSVDGLCGARSTLAQMNLVVDVVVVVFDFDFDFGAICVRVCWSQFNSDRRCRADGAPRSLGRLVGGHKLVSFRHVLPDGLRFAEAAFRLPRLAVSQHMTLGAGD